MTTQPFDAAAAGYDASFTYSPLGRWLRRAVWERLDAAFLPGDHVLELGCGTGEDALHLARRGVRVHATDVSTAMLEAARRKAAHDGTGDRITFARLDLASLSTLPPPAAPYDGSFANFGVLNCVPDLGRLATALAAWIRPGGRAVWVVLGPLCPWEWAWYGLRGHTRTAFRRLRPSATARVGGGPPLQVRYPSPAALRRAFAPAFRPLETAGIGVLLPPSYANRLVERWPRLFERLARLDRRAGRTFPGTWLNDHYLIVLERTEHEVVHA